MPPIFFAFTFLTAWCITLFCVLPFRISMKRKLLWNTLLAFIVTMFIHLLLKSGIIPLREAYL